MKESLSLPALCRPASAGSQGFGSARSGRSGKSVRSIVADIDALANKAAEDAGAPPLQLPETEGTRSITGSAAEASPAAPEPRPALTKS